MDALVVLNFQGNSDASSQTWALLPTFDRILENLTICFHYRVSYGKKSVVCVIIFV